MQRVLPAVNCKEVKASHIRIMALPGCLDGLVAVYGKGYSLLVSLMGLEALILGMGAAGWERVRKINS